MPVKGVEAEAALVRWYRSNGDDDSEIHDLAQKLADEAQWGGTETAAWPCDGQESERRDRIEEAKRALDEIRSIARGWAERNDDARAVLSWLEPIETLIADLSDDPTQPQDKPDKRDMKGSGTDA